MQKSTTPIQAWMQTALREGLAHLNHGRINEASACCRKLLSAKPDLVEAHFLVGLIAREIKETGNAIQAFGSVTRLKPDHGAAWANLAFLLVRAGHAGRADAALAKAVAHADNNPHILDLIGQVHGQLGEHEIAGGWYERALAGDPESIPFQINLANNHRFLDRTDQATHILEHVIERVPGHPNAHWLMSGLRKATDRDHVRTLEGLIAKVKNPRALAFLYYGLGKELEDLEDWDGAFHAFQQGASERRKTLEFNEALEQTTFDAFTETFTEDWLSQGPTGDLDPSPIFVVGQPRTGTTLIERIIVAHSQVHSAGELRQFGHCLRRLGDYREQTNYSPKLAEIGAQVDPEKLGSAYLASTAKLRGDTPRFVDKLPPNFLYIPLILKSLPNAKIVHLRRGPMDACFASFKQLFADAYPHSYEQSEMARHHARYFKLMDTWRQRFGDRFLDVSYEDTAANLEPNARELISFLGLPWEDACLSFHEQEGAVTTASSVQVRQPAHTRSVGRWRRYEEQLTSMRTALEEEGIPLEL
ncbi:MAG: sulfotransferase [Pseudomonadota bacterium]